MSTTDPRIRNATTSTAWLRIMLRTLDELGCDGARLARESGISPRYFERPDLRVPQLTMSEFWRAALEATGDPGLGLEVARRAGPSAFGTLTHAILVSPTLADGLRRWVRYQRLMSDAQTPRFEMAGSVGRLTSIPLSDEHPPAEVIDATLYIAARLARGLAGRGKRVNPRRVQMRRPRPPDPHALRFEEAFACEIEFGAPSNSIEFDAADLASPLPDANLELANAYDQILARQLARVENASMSDRVRGAVLDMLADGPSEAKVAKHLHLSRSSLKARLARESTSYKAILEDVRERLAKEYLLERHYSAKEIAFLLGYADASTFSRAFKRWTGETLTSHGLRRRQTPARG